MCVFADKERERHNILYHQRINALKCDEKITKTNIINLSQKWNKGIKNDLHCDVLP